MVAPTTTPTMVRPPDLDDQDPRVRRTLALIEDAFSALLGEKGFQSITVSDITRLATINRATFYAHFQDKYELFDHMIAKTFHEHLRSRLDVTCSFNRLNLHTLITAIQEYLAYHMKSCSVPAAQPDFQPSVFQQVQRQVQMLVNHWLSGMGIEDDPASTAVMLSWAVLGTGISGNEKKMIGETLDLDQAVEFLTRGLSGLGYKLD